MCLGTDRRMQDLVFFSNLKHTALSWQRKDAGFCPESTGDKVEERRLFPFAHKSFSFTYYSKRADINQFSCKIKRRFSMTFILLD